MVPFGRNECFVEPGSILRRLLARIPPSANRDNCQRTAIDGLGGIGKTQVAVEAAFRVHDTQPECSIFWISALSATSFENAYRDIGCQLQIKGIDESNADVKKLVNSALDEESMGEWLLIVDNIDDERLFDDEFYNYFPSSHKGSILITTRMHKIAAKFDIENNIITMPKMSQAEALDLLQKGLDKSRTQDSQSDKNLIYFLEYLPLAIKQASAYIATNSTSTKKYLELCQSSKNLTILLSEPFKDGTRYPDDNGINNPVATTWLISFDDLSQNKPLAAKYMRFICCLSEQDIPFFLLPDTQDQLETDKAIGTLKDYAFITERQGSESFDIHRLVRLAMRNWLEKQGKLREWLGKSIQQLSLKFPIPKYDNHKLLVKALPHAQTALQSQYEITPWPVTIELLFKVAKGLYILGQYKSTKQMLQQALELQKKVLPEEHPKILITMSDLGAALQDQGKYKEAEQILQQALKLQKKVLSEDHPDLLVTMARLGAVFKGQARYKEAEQMLQQVLKLQKKVLSEKCPEILITMIVLGAALQGQGKYKETEQILQQALKLQKKVLSEEHPDISITMGDLSAALHNQGKYEEAEQMLQQVLELQKKVLSEDHPDLFVTIARLGAALQKQGKNEEAEQIHQQKKSG